ncbi:MAG: hypothetical protein WCI59_21395 [Betaproteobacteria bacterium]|jgi:hypothetical protein
MPYYFGINTGQNEYTPPAQGASTTSRDVEVVINTNANVPSLQDLINSLRQLENFILRNGKPW